MKVRFITISLVSIILFLSCSKPKWDNPFDTNVNISISNIQIEQISINQIRLEWDVNFNTSGGQIHIDKRVNYDDFQQNYAIVDINTNTWTDNDAEINQNITYRLRGTFDQNEFEVETIPFINEMPVPENLTFEILYPNRIPLIWEYNLAGIDGYEIHRQIGTANWNNVATINYTNSWNWTDYSFVYGENYKYKISAFYDGVYSVFSNELIINVSEIFWDDGQNSWGIGQANAGAVDFDVAIRFNTSELTQYNGMYLVQVEFFPNENNCEYSIRVWTGGNVSGGEGNSGTRVVNQLVSNPNINHWNQVKLDNPVNIDSSKELWIGYRCNTQSGYPAGADEGPAVAWKGDLIYWNNIWQRLDDIGDDLDFNWNLLGIVNTTNVRNDKTITFANENEKILLK